MYYMYFYCVHWLAYVQDCKLKARNGSNTKYELLRSVAKSCYQCRLEHFILYVSCTNLSLEGTKQNFFRDFPHFLLEKVMYSVLHTSNLLKPSGFFTYHQV